MLSRPMNATEWALLVSLSILWGGSFFFAKVAVEALPPLTLVLLRVALGAAVLGAVMAAMGVPVPRGARVWAAFCVLALLNNVVPFTLFFWGQTIIAAGLAAILNATTPLFTVLAAHVFTEDERITPAKLAGVAVGLLGVVVLVGPQALGGLNRAVWAELACLAGAVSFALAGIFGRRFARMRVAPLATSFGQLAMASVLTLPLALLIDDADALARASMAVWAAVAALAVLSTALGYIIYFRLLATVGATNVLLVTLLVPVSAILLGALVLSERLSLNAFAGMGLIGLGLALIDGRLLAAMRQA